MEVCCDLGDPTFWSFWMAEWWVTRDNCGYFPVWFVVAYIVSQVSMAMAFFAIAYDMTLLRSPGLNRLPFVFRSCAWSHLLDGALVFFWPNYMLFFVVHSITSIAAFRARADLRSVIRRANLVQDISSSDVREADRLLKDLRNRLGMDTHA